MNIKTLYNIITFIFLFIILQGCSNKPSTDLHYINIKLRIVAINYETSLSQDKFHRLQGCNIILFETLDEPKLYMQINTCEFHQQIHIDTEWLYNHKIGDTVHFDYLLKTRFFIIKN